MWKTVRFRRNRTVFCIKRMDENCTLQHKKFDLLTKRREKAILNTSDSGTDLQTGEIKKEVET